jgi:hypothetical protein
MQKATTFEHGGKVYEVRAIPTLNGWKVRIFVEGIPANGFTYSVDSEVYQDAAIDGVPEDLVAGLMETAERDFRRGLAQELVAAEKATEDDIAAAGLLRGLGTDVSAAGTALIGLSNSIGVYGYPRHDARSRVARALGQAENQPGASPSA